MPAGQSISNDIASPANGHSLPSDLFALTDEQILDIEPEGEVNVAPPFRAASSLTQPHGASPSADAVHSVIPSEARDPGNTGEPASSQSVRHDSTSLHRNDASAQSGSEPPPWIAAQMKDPWTGEAAKELWNGAQQAKQEAAAYREAFATPEDARALKDLYPGGVNEARAASERARVLDDIDRAFFGAAGKSAQETSASREQLAQMMLREDPAAFREMVFAGLRALEASGAQANSGPNVGARFSASPATAESGAAPPASHATQTGDGLKSAPTDAPAYAAPHPHAAENSTHLAAYSSFEKAANEDLERSVGASIERTIAQALPNASRMTTASGVGAQHAAPLQARLSAAVRQDVEAALKGDRQLGDQIVQILSGRRFDNETRAQVVRLIGERANQLVPTAAKRVLSDWTQATLAAHRGQSSRSDAAAARRELEPAAAPPGALSAKTTSSASSARATAPRLDTRRVDYRKLSDEQILEL